MTNPIRITYDELGPNPFQNDARPGGIDMDHARRLARNIRANHAQLPGTAGLRDVPRVRPTGEGYQIEDGHHRIAACKLLYEGDGTEEFPGDPRWATVPAVVEAIDDDLMLTALMDSDLKKHLSPIGWARGWQRLAEQGWSQADIAVRYDTTQPTVSKRLALLDLPAPVQALIDDGTLSARHGEALLWMARYLPDVLDEYIQKQGVGLWMTPMRGSGGEHEVQPVADLEHHVYQAIRNSTRTLGFWDLDWEPHEDERLTEEELARYEGKLRAGSCAECPFNTAYKNEQRCLDPTCHHARRDASLYIGEKERQAERMRRAAELREEMHAPPPKQEPRPVASAAAQTQPVRQQPRPPERDYHGERNQIHKTMMRDLRRVFEQQPGLFEPEIAARSVPLLQFLDDAVNRPKGWGEPSTETNPDVLWGNILAGVLKKLSGGSNPAHDQYKRPVAVVEALGVEIAPEVFDALARHDAEHLVAVSEKVTEAHSRNIAFYLSTMENLLELGACALTADQAEVVAANLHAVLGGQDAGEYTHRIRAMLQTVEDRVRAPAA